jgi:cell wall-associated NlpC family hydrolase
MTEQEFRARIVREALSFVGTPYHLGGMVKGAGVDCATLLLLIYRSCALIPPEEETHRLSQDWWQHTSVEH